VVASCHSARSSLEALTFLTTSAATVTIPATIRSFFSTFGTPKLAQLPTHPGHRKSNRNHRFAGLPGLGPGIDMTSGPGQLSPLTQGPRHSWG
jgi:hypothetical protein